MADTTPGPGQPRKMQRPGGRTERVRQQVVAATTAILAEDGITGITVEAVASRSGVARTTIYRRWPSPELLLLEALREELGPRASRVEDTGSFRTDVAALLRDVAAFSTSEQGRAIMQAVFITPGFTDVEAAVRPYWEQRFAAAGEIIRRAVGRGELPEDADERFILELGVAPVYFRIFLTRDPVDAAYLDRIVEFVLAGCGAREVAGPRSAAGAH
jgi:AcrR family transcriptional regulator